MASPAALSDAQKGQLASAIRKMEADGIDPETVHRLSSEWILKQTLGGTKVINPAGGYKPLRVGPSTGTSVQSESAVETFLGGSQKPAPKQKDPNVVSGLPEAVAKLNRGEISSQSTQMQRFAEAIIVKYKLPQDKARKLRHAAARAKEENDVARVAYTLLPVKSAQEVQKAAPPSPHKQMMESGAVIPVDDPRNLGSTITEIAGDAAKGLGLHPLIGELPAYFAAAPFYGMQAGVKAQQGDWAGAGLDLLQTALPDIPIRSLGVVSKRLLDKAADSFEKGNWDGFNKAVDQLGLEPNKKAAVRDFFVQAVQKGDETPGGIANLSKRKGAKPVEKAPDPIPHQPEPPASGLTDTGPLQVDLPKVADGGVATANKVMNTARRIVGLPSFSKSPKESVEEWAKAAVEKGYTTPDGADAIAKRILDPSDALTHLDKEMEVGLASATDELSELFNTLSDQYVLSAERGGDSMLAGALEDIRSKLSRISDATNRAGSEWGRSGVARQAFMKADGSFAGILARRQKITERPLTSHEVEAARKEANALKDTITKKDARIAELEAEQNRAAAQSVLNDHGKTVKRSADRVVKINERINAASERLKTKWAESVPTGIRSSLFGAEIAAEQAARIAKVAPEILEIAKAKFELGYVNLSDNAAEVVKHLKQLRVKGIDENGVAAVIAGRIKGEGRLTRTDWESFKQDASDIFTERAKERNTQRRFVEAKAQQVKQEFQRSERKKAYDALRKERDALAAEEKAAKDAERAFWKDVRAREREFQKGQRDAAKLDRLESIRRWRASVQGERAAAMNRIDKLQEKLDAFEKEGFVPGSSSRLPRKPDDALRELEIKEASLRRQMKKVDDELAEQEVYNNLPDSLKFIRAWFPWNAARSLVASFDHSFPWNQGGMALWSDPKSWGKATAKSFKAITEAGHDKIMSEMRTHPMYDKAEAANLFEGRDELADLFGADRISKVPGIKQSQQLYDAAANLLRLDVFDHWVQLAEVKKPLNLDDLRVLATEVKTWTGQGVWGNRAEHIRKPFFALRYRLSQFETASGAPMLRTARYGMETGQWAPFKVVARKYAQAYTTMGVTVGIVNEGLKRFGPKDKDGKPLAYIEMRREATNFGRLVIRGGKVAYDVLPPAMRLYGFMSRMWDGERISMNGNLQSSKDFQNRSLRAEMALQYGGGGLHPIARVPFEYMLAKDSDDKSHFGRSYDPKKMDAWIGLVRSFLPLSVQQELQTLLDNPDLTPWEKAFAVALAPVIPVHMPPKTSGKAQLTPPKTTPMGAEYKPPVPAGV